MALAKTFLIRSVGVRYFGSSTTKNAGFKVALIGASGGIGQPLALLLKAHPLISKLALYDIVNTPGVAADLSHINTPAVVSSHQGADQLKTAVDGADLIIVPAGVPRKPGMTRDDLFNTNASVVRDVSEIASKTSPKAILAIITNPVNSTVPIASEVYKKNNTYDERKIFGVTTLDIVRAGTFIAQAKQLDVKQVECPVIGGHSGITIIPVVSQAKPAVKFDKAMLDKLTVRIQEAGTEVVNAKAGTGSATLSMAFAANRFATSILNALSGKSNIVECAYVKSNIVPGIDYFSSPILLGKNGIEKNLGFGTLSDFEKNLLDKALPELKKNIENGVKFIKK
uniref:Malate dehydrogenase n=1 Tax=Romanomermis culicivorax TaxID=13658 RepID=A0A915L0G0_ROMCU